MGARLFVFLLLFVLLGVVKAAVVINVFEEAKNNPEVVADEDILGEGCNELECGIACRAQGFARGLCIAGRCHCFQITKDNEYTLESGCNYQACDQLCRRLGFTGGVCVGDRCKCDNFSPLTDNEYSLEGCNYQACDQLCRRLGFAGGVCVGGRCKCDIMLELKDDSMTKLEAVGGCTKKACRNVCHKLGYKHGICIFGKKCVCYNVVNNKDNLERLSCNDSSCDALCRRKGYLYGLCINNKCVCSKALNELTNYGTEINDDNNNRIDNETI
ncbi:tenascin-like [Leguminivora glycinivorella]|uniref:tenascin-like n=1 Tax=Leguminivora glycinivorella TaxID=1035111 RepID=UPI00200BE194|nr:tenascin-like [Leguminivora glycinivorella]